MCKGQLGNCFNYILSQEWLLILEVMGGTEQYKEEPVHVPWNFPGNTEWSVVITCCPLRSPVLIQMGNSRNAERSCLQRGKIEISPNHIIFWLLKIVSRVLYWKCFLFLAVSSHPGLELALSAHSASVYLELCIFVCLTHHLKSMRVEMVSFSSHVLSFSYPNSFIFSFFSIKF